MSKYIPNEYEQEAIDFCERWGIEIKADRLGTFPHFDEDDTPRDVYNVSIVTAKGAMTLKYGDSITNTEARQGNAQPMGYRKRMTQGELSGYQRKMQKKWRKPSEYDILACITKYDPGTFNDFCSDFGYDNDSKKAEKTYFAIQEEWENVRRIFTEEQLEELQEIN
jgi:hypothetical protein